jgi:hypothetical protein
VAIIDAIFAETIKELGLEDGRPGHFRKYAWRRGGAQDMYIHSDEPCTLSVFKGWCGWSEGEDVRFDG